MAIDQIEEFPDRSDPAFKARVETFFETEFPESITQINAAVEALNTNDTIGTSVTAFTPGNGVKTFVTQSGKSWLPGMWVSVGYTSDGREWMAGPVKSYSGTSLEVEVLANSGHVTSRSAWSIALSPHVADVIGDQEVRVHTGNGYGSTNTKRRRYTTTEKNAGSDISYADSATLGASFTINANGDYQIWRQERYNSGQGTIGVVLNPSSGTTAYLSLASAEKIGAAYLATTVSIAAVVGIVTLVAGDVVAPHEGSATLDGVTDDCFMSVKRVR